MTTDTGLVEIAKLVRNYCDACSLADDLQTEQHNKLAASDGHELYKAINAVFADRDKWRKRAEEAEAEAKSERAENQLHCACEFETRIEMLSKEHYEFPRVICKIHQDIVNDRDQWKKLAEVRTKPTST